MKNKFFKKVLIFIFIFFGFSSSLLVKGTNTETQEVHFHYFRFDGNYAPWDMWIWKHKPTSEGGAGFAFVDDEGEYSFGGKKVVVKLEGNLAGTTELGFIVRKPDWSQKDIDNDRHVAINPTSPNGVQHVYLVEGDPLIGHSLTDPNGPSKFPKFKAAYFTEENKIFFTTTEPITQDKVKLFKDDLELTFAFLEQGNGYVLTLNENVDFSKSYKVEGIFTDDYVNDLEVTYDGIYSSDAFHDAYYYDGTLGVSFTNTQTIFRLWAPISKAVTLNLYHSGTTTRDGGTSDIPNATHEMNKIENGVWEIKLEGNLHNTYYTYSVTNGSVTHEVVDPYAVSGGVNGRRGLVVDFSKVNPEGFEYNSRPDNMINHTDAIIYELHVRDLSTHSSWNGPEEMRGKFLGLIEEGTTCNGYKTGFDHIKDLGITHIQLIPIFDFGVVDETKLEDKDYNSFNWGYMPLNFNMPEGSYSSNPYDGLTRVKELKQVTMAYTKNNIRLNMDVVYNHTGLSADSNFNLILPGYFHRKTDTNAFSNGSGTGNETASERSMVRKFIVDSLLMWTHEYNISGYRFDLMALHDLETMNQIYNELTAIDPTIMVYGEPWMGGTTPLPASNQAGKKNLHLISGVGAFNDDFRDAMKGSVFNREYPGFVQGVSGAEVINRVKYGIVGGVKHNGVTESHLSGGKTWHTEPGKTINYVTAHDNNTLYDKLYQTNEITNQLDLIDEMVMQAYAVLLTSQGVVFIHAGDEILRSKPNANGVGFDHNSYESPDSVNQIRWDLKGKPEQTKVNAYIKGLIKLRKEFPQLRLTTKEEINEKVSFLYEDQKSVIAYQVKGDKDLLIIHNANVKRVKLTLPNKHGYDVLVNKDTAGLTAIKSYKAGEPIKVNAHESLILIENTDTEVYVKPFPWLTVTLISISVIALAGVGVGVVFFLKKKQ